MFSWLLAIYKWPFLLLLYVIVTVLLFVPLAEKNVSEQQLITDSEFLQIVDHIDSLIESEHYWEFGYISSKEVTVIYDTPNRYESDEMLSQTDVLINVRDTPRWASNAIYREYKCDVPATTETTKCTYAIYNSYYAIEVSTNNTNNCEELFKLEFQRMLQAVAKAQGE